MSIPDPVQTLVGAFTFGLLLQAALGGLLIFLNGHTTSLWQDRRRLVLSVFISSAALWALFNFVNFLLPSDQHMICQATLILSTTFDQAARVAIEGFILWSLGQSTKSALERNGFAALLVIRGVGGGVFVGFTRPQFEPVCVARSELLPVSVAVLALDGIILGIILIRFFTLGLWAAMSDGRSETNQEQSRALAISVVGLAIWMGTSVPMLLGLESIILLIKTSMPATGLQILVGIVAIFGGQLLSGREERIGSPEALSPFGTPPQRASVSEDDGSPVDPPGWQNTRSLFVVNPSASQATSPAPMPQALASLEEKESKKRGNTVVRAVEVDAGGSELRIPRSDQIRIPRSMTAPLAYSTTNIIAAAAVRPIPKPTPQQKRWLFNSSKSDAKPSISKVNISQPIMNEPSSPNAAPFTRMATIDLATAAEKEKERRRSAAARQLVAKRPAPPPPTRASDGLARSTSVVRKQAPAASQDPWPERPVAVAQDASGLSVDAVAVTTSASLSPGVEDVRRRSPRNPRAFDDPEEKLALPQAQAQLSRRPTLPSNPKAPRFTTPSVGPAQNPPTVMLLNDIVYDNPAAVNAIIAKTPRVEAVSVPAGPKSPSGGSVIHRPRPYRKISDADRVIFPSEVPGQHRRNVSGSSNHKRTKSESSVVRKKSILNALPGDPSNLPPLPPLPQTLPPAPLPTSASKLPRILPNRTKSMTFEEKMELLFPAPPVSSSRGRLRRVSSVPSIPPIPSNIVTPQRPEKKPMTEELKSRRDSKRTTIASFGDEPVIATKFTGDKPTKVAVRSTQQFSASASRELADGTRESWVLPTDQQGPNEPKPMQDEAQIEKSPTNLPKPKSAYTITSADISILDDITDDWVSVHSPVPPVDITSTRARARSTTIQRENPRLNLDASRPLPQIPLPTDSPPLDNEDSEVMTFMLDPEEASNLSRSSSKATNRESTWHRRIGDELPAFSKRLTKRNTRTVPPPTPLLLASNGKKATVVVHDASPVPINSTERAIKEIQNQLKKFESANGQSVDSILLNLPKPETSMRQSPTSSMIDRAKLLETLEQEMGQQENQWQALQHNFDRDSNSTFASTAAASTPVKEQRRASQSSDSSHSSSNRSIRVSRRPRMSSKASTTSGSLVVPSPQQADIKRASVWQQRLADAQMQYLENAPDLLKNRSVNFLSMNKAQLGSPTPPESEGSSTDIESEAGVEVLTNQKYSGSLPTPDSFSEPDIKQLWTMRSAPQHFSDGLLWSHHYGSSDLQDNSPEAPAQSLRPSVRRQLHELSITSRRLWVKAPTLEATIFTGLWRSKSRPKSVTSRPLTQRPQRRSKRATFLPDIIEEPLPLPNKRDTLGIFQFPWGEKSDSAVYRPVLGPSLISGPVFRGSYGLPANPRPQQHRESQQQQELEYSSTFFDDYDEDFDGDNEAEFAENTLADIASLLQISNIPSRNSLLPSSSVIDEYEAEDSDYDDFDYASDYSEEDRLDRAAETAATSQTMLQLPIQPLAVRSPRSPMKSPMRSPRKMLRQFLWTPRNEKVASNFGLPQPSPSIWREYQNVTGIIARSKSGSATQLPTLESRELWRMAASTQDSDSIKMWSDRVSASKQTTTICAQSRDLLWTPSVKEAVKNLGLPQPATHVWLKYQKATGIATHSNSGLSKQMPVLESRDLWSLPVSAPVGNPSIKMWSSRIDRSEPTNALWTQPKNAVEEVRSDGLWQIQGRRLTFKTTSLSPAAKDLTFAPRYKKADIARLESQELWTSPPSPEQNNWILASTSRPKSAIAVSTRTRQLLWERPESFVKTHPDGLFQAHIPRTTFKVTSLDPAAKGIMFAPRYKRAGIAQLESQGLWAAPRSAEQKHWIFASTSRTQTVPLWQRSKKSVEETHPDGLFQAHIRRTTFRATGLSPAAQNMVLVPRYKRGDVAQLNSRGLWTPPPHTEQMNWISASVNLPASTRSELKPRLWSKRPLTNSDKVALTFTVAASGPRFSTDSSAATDMSRKPRKCMQPLPTLQSRNLWNRRQEVPVRPQLWSKKPRSAGRELVLSFTVAASGPTFSGESQTSATMHPRKSRQNTKPLPKLQSRDLWNQFEKAPMRLPLWSKKLHAAGHNTVLPFTAAASGPAFSIHSQISAVTKPRKPRQNTKPLPKLQSQNLWHPSRSASPSPDWISASSTLALSPASSTGTSPSASPTSSIFSLASVSTKASSLKNIGRASTAVMKAWWEMGPKTTAISASKDQRKQPRLREIASSDFDKKRGSETEVRGNDVLEVKRGLKRPVAVSLSDWEDALEEAVVASYSRPKAVSSANWEDALEEAVIASYSKPKAVSSADWEEALVDALAASYSEPKSWHVTEELKTRPFQTLTWVPTPEKQESAVGVNTLWSLDSHQRRSSIFGNVKQEYVRKAKGARQTILPSLVSDRLWEMNARVLDDGQRRHWLHETSAKQMEKEADVNMLWSSGAAGQRGSIFGDVEREYVRKVRSASEVMLPELASDGLWDVEAGSGERHMKDWLHDSST